MTGPAPSQSDRSPERWRLVNLLAFLALAAFLLLFWWRYGLGYLGHDFIDARSYWLGAHIAFVQGLSPYGPDFEDFGVAAGIGFAHPFVYPPPSLLLFSPLAALDYPSAAKALLIANHLSLLLLVGAVARIWRPAFDHAATPAALCGVAVFIMAAQSTRITLGHGQMNIIVISGLLWFWAAYRGLAPGWVGAVGLIVAVLLKPYFGVFAIFMTHPSGRRLIPPTLYCTVLTLALSFAFLPGGVWRDWIANFLLSIGDPELYLGRYAIFGPDNHALRQAGDALISAATGIRASPFRDSFAYIAFAMIAAQLLAAYGGGVKPERDEATFATLLCLVFLLAPISWVHYILYPLIGALILVAAAIRRRRWFSAIALALMALILFQRPPIRDVGALLNNYQTLIVLAVWVLGLWLAVSRRRGEG